MSPVYLDVPQKSDRIIGATGWCAAAIYPDVLEWCFNALGYFPPLTSEHDEKTGIHQSSKIAFQYETDMLLFQITFAQRLNA